MGGLVRQVLAAFFLGLFLVLLGVAGLHLGEGEVREHTHDSAARAEVDACLLDEAVVVVLLGYGTLRADADLHGAEVAQTDDFATAEGIDDDILSATSTANTSLLCTVQVCWMRSDISRRLMSPLACTWP